MPIKNEDVAKLYLPMQTIPYKKSDKTETISKTRLKYFAICLYDILDEKSSETTRTKQMSRYVFIFAILSLFIAKDTRTNIKKTIVKIKGIAIGWMLLFFKSNNTFLGLIGRIKTKIDISPIAIYKSILIFDESSKRIKPFPEQRKSKMVNIE